ERAGIDARKSDLASFDVPQQRLQRWRRKLADPAAALGRRPCVELGNPEPDESQRCERRLRPELRLTVVWLERPVLIEPRPRAVGASELPIDEGDHATLRT